MRSRGELTGLMCLFSRARRVRLRKLRRLTIPRIVLRSLALALALVAGRTSSALAGEESPVDIDLREVPALRRILALDGSPLPLFTMDRISGNVIFVPVHPGVLEVR